MDLGEFGDEWIRIGSWQIDYSITIIYGFVHKIKISVKRAWIGLWRMVVLGSLANGSLDSKYLPINGGVYLGSQQFDNNKSEDWEWIESWCSLFGESIN